MDRREKFCYYVCTLLARIIGITEVIVHLIVMIGLVGELTGTVEGNGKYAIFIGIDSKEFNFESKNLTECTNVTMTNCTAKDEMSDSDWFILACYVFAIVHTLASCLLIWATIMLTKHCTIPWFVCKVLRMTVQIFGFVYYNVREETLEASVLIPALVNIVITTLSSYIVYQAVKRWPQRRRRRRSYVVVEEDNGDENDNTPHSSAQQPGSSEVPPQQPETQQEPDDAQQPEPARKAHTLQQQEDEIQAIEDDVEEREQEGAAALVEPHTQQSARKLRDIALSMVSLMRRKKVQQVCLQEFIRN